MDLTSYQSQLQAPLAPGDRTQLPLWLASTALLTKNVFFSAQLFVQTYSHAVSADEPVCAFRGLMWHRPPHWTALTHKHTWGVRRLGQIISSSHCITGEFDKKQLFPINYLWSISCCLSAQTDCTDAWSALIFLHLKRWHSFSTYFQFYLNVGSMCLLRHLNHWVRFMEDIILFRFRHLN